MHPTKTAADMLDTLTAEHARLSADLVALTARVGERFTSIAEGMKVGAFINGERPLIDACSDALALPRLAAHLFAVQSSINLLRHVVSS